MVLDTDIAFRFTHHTVSLVLPRKVTGPKLSATYCESAANPLGEWKAGIILI